MQQFIYTPAGRLVIEAPVISFLKFSHLYGYRGLTAISEEQDVIRYVVEAIASSSEPIEQTVARLVEELNSRGSRRSGKRWLRSTVLGLVRPVFGGRIAVAGGYAVSQHYPEIVPWAVMVKALAKLK